MIRAQIASLLRRGMLEKAMDLAVRHKISCRDFNQMAKRFYKK